MYLCVNLWLKLLVSARTLIPRLACANKADSDVNLLPLFMRAQKEFRSYLAFVQIFYAPRNRNMRVLEPQIAKLCSKISVSQPFVLEAQFCFVGPFYVPHSSFCSIQ